MGNRNYMTEDCYAFSALFNEYYDNELDETARRNFEAHLNMCPECAADYERFRTAVLSVRASARRPRESVAGSVMAAIRNGEAGRPASRRRHVPIGTIAALAAVVAIVALNREAFGFFGSNLKNAGGRAANDAATSAEVQQQADMHDDARFSVRTTLPTYGSTGTDAGVVDNFAFPPKADGMIDAEIPYVPSTEADVESGTAVDIAGQENMHDAKLFSAADPDAQAAEAPAAADAPTVDEGQIREQMAQIGEKMKTESGFAVTVKSTYLINTFDEALQQQLLAGMNSREDKGMFVIASASESILQQRIAEQAELSWYSYAGTPDANEIVVIFY